VPTLSKTDSEVGVCFALQQGSGCSSSSSSSCCSRPGANQGMLCPSTGHNWSRQQGRNGQVSYGRVGGYTRAFLPLCGNLSEDSRACLRCRRPGEVVVCRLCRREGLFTS